MPGTRRARALVAGIAESIGGALTLADQLDDLADRVEGLPAGGGRGVGVSRARGPGDPRSADHLGDVTGTVAAATELTRGATPGLAGAPWTSPRWPDPRPPGGPGDGGRPESAAVIPPALWRVGRVVVPSVPGATGPPDQPSGRLAVPLAVPLLDGTNLLVEVPAARRPEGVGVIRGLVTRLLAAVPAGMLRLTVYDPHELGAGIAGLAPLRAAGIMDPTLTTRAALETALADLSEEVGRITAERLGGRFASLRDRAVRGTARGEPWRVVVLLGRPSLADDAARALEAIAASGPACGVCVLALTETDTRREPGQRAPRRLPRSESITASATGWTCSLTGSLAVEPDPPPPADLPAIVATAVAAEAARTAARPLDLRHLLPARLWSGDAANGLTVGVGTSTDGPVTLTFDDDTVHGLVGGQAGAGKSTLLLDVVYGLAARYPPDELRMHLLDFKEGLEFAQFAQVGPGRPDRPAFYLPHADTVGMDSDREFGVAVLRGVRSQMQRRAVTMREYGARDLAAMRAADPTRAWPRVLVVIDEFQVMLSPLDAVSREGVGHLEAIARQGRAYGIHLLLASQTLSGIDALDGLAGKRGSIFGQFALRVALRTSIAESRVLLSTANEEAGGLAGVGQAIVNRRNGHPTGNERVRVAYADPDTLTEVRGELARAAAREIAGGTRAGSVIRPPRVFVGHEPAILDANPLYRALLDGQSVDPEPVALLGVPLDVEPAAVGVRLSALPGRNLAVLGPARREAVGALQAAVASAAAGLAPGQLRVDLVCADPAAALAVDVLAERVHGSNQVAVVSPVAALPELLRALAGTVRDREGAATGHPLTPTEAPTGPDEVDVGGGGDGRIRFMVIVAADSARAALELKDPDTRRSGLDDLRFLTRRGPSVGVHVLAWWRSPGRVLDDLGPAHRDDLGAWVAVGVPASDLYSLAGNRPIAASPGPNRAVLFDRHGGAEPRTIVPFAPLEPGGGQAAVGTGGGARAADQAKP